MDLFAAYQFTRREHWQNVARKMTRWNGWGGPYRKRLNRVVKSLTVPGLRVLSGIGLRAGRPAGSAGAFFWGGCGFFNAHAAASPAGAPRFTLHCG